MKRIYEKNHNLGKDPYPLAKWYVHFLEQQAQKEPQERAQLTSKDIANFIREKDQKRLLTIKPGDSTLS
jgi:HPt (histidine-containing phosphotransfer) domain-containing protein